MSMEGLTWSSTARTILVGPQRGTVTHLMRGRRCDSWQHRGCGPGPTGSGISVSRGHGDGTLSSSEPAERREWREGSAGNAITDGFEYTEAPTDKTSPLIGMS